MARPGDEQKPNLEWNSHRRGARAYNTRAGAGWKWNYNFKATPGEFFFDPSERKRWDSLTALRKLVIIEPNIPLINRKPKAGALNKQWPVSRYQLVADELTRRGCNVAQFDYEGRSHRLLNTYQIKTTGYREAVAALERAALYIGPEGGMSHAAAAVNVRGVVLFGHFIPPEVTGYDSHVNLTGGVGKACGSLVACPRCRQAMDNITVGEVVDHAARLVNEVTAGSRWRRFWL